jgi:pimeloyl-ACP methyl ester carboxylesterase
MAKAYTEELVFIESEDGIALDGAVIRPDGGEARPTVVVWVHGLTGRFYGASAVLIGRELATRGYTLVTGNNRGNHFGAMLRLKTGEAFLGGGGWERFDESPYDVGAWVGFAEKLGFERIVLLGHSLGALKVGFYQATRQDPRVVGLIVASAPVRAGRLRPDLLELAQRMLAEGRGKDLLPWGSMQAGGGTLSAETYMSWRHPDFDTYGIDRADPPISRVRCPILALYGTDEAWVGGAVNLEMIRRNATSAARVNTQMIEGADHVYTGHETAVAGVIGEWLGTL